MKGFAKIYIIFLAIIIAGVLVAGAIIYSNWKFSDGSQQQASVNPPDETTGEISEPILGSPDALVTIIEYSDYTCPFCAAASGYRKDVIDYLREQDPTWEAPRSNIVEEYVKSGKVRLVFRPFPIHGELSIKTAEATFCAGEQDNYWQMHDILFKNQDKLKIDNLGEFAKDLELNLKEFNTCLDSGKYEETVRVSYQKGVDAGVTGTPTFFINGQKISGAQSFSVFKQIIEMILAE